MTPEEREKRLLALEKRKTHIHSADLDDQVRAQSSKDTLDRVKRKSKFTETEAKLKIPRVNEIDSASASDARSVESLKDQHRESLQFNKTIIKQEVINLDSDEDEAPEKTVSDFLDVTKPAVCGTKHSGPRYKRGQVLLTSAAGYPVQSHHVSIENLIDRDNLRRAVLSAFQIDLEWTLSKLNVGRTAIHIVCEAKTDDTKQQWQRVAKAVPKLNVIFPPMNHANCMHSKLQLLFFDDFLRFATPSANLMPYDWGETGVMENVMYVQDFPLKKAVTASDDTEDESDADETQDSTFLADLTYFLRRSMYPESIIADLQKYSFSETSEIRFVASVGGENYAPHDLQKSGLPRLTAAIKSLRQSVSALRVEYITASIGALNKSFVTSFMNACHGRAPFDKTRTDVYESLRERLRIYFPTREVVLRSRAGHAGTICFQSSYYGKSEFPIDSLMTHVAVREGLLSHCKMILCRDVRDEKRGWAYVGSANFSASAWGDRIVKDRATKRDRMNCRNWECGVVVPMSMANGAIPVERSATRNSDPWYFMEE